MEKSTVQRSTEMTHVMCPYSRLHVSKLVQTLLPRVIGPASVVGLRHKQWVLGIYTHLAVTSYQNKRELSGGEKDNSGKL